MSTKQELKLSDEFIGLNDELSSKFKKMFGNKFITGNMVNTPDFIAHKQPEHITESLDLCSEDELYSDLSDEDYIESTETSGLLSMIPQTQSELNNDITVVSKKKRVVKLQNLSPEERQKYIEERKRKTKEYQQQYQKEYRTKYRGQNKEYYAQYLKEYITTPEYKEHRKEYIEKNRDRINKLHSINHRIKNKVFTMVKEMFTSGVLEIKDETKRKQLLMLYEAFEDKTKVTEELIK